MSTFSQLQTDIKNYMEDDGTEFSTSLTQFISNTELKLSRDLSTPEFKRKVTSAFTANDPFLTMPTDLVTLEHLQVACLDIILILIHQQYMLLQHHHQIFLLNCLTREDFPHYQAQTQVTFLQLMPMMRYFTDALLKRHYLIGTIN